MTETQSMTKSRNGMKPTESDGQPAHENGHYRARSKKQAEGAINSIKGLEKLNLSAENVLELIKVGAASGVAKIKFGDLELEFGQNTKPPESPANDVTPAPADAAISVEQNRKIQKEALEREEFRTREDQVEHMIIEDPLKAEELIADGELLPDDADDDE